MASTIQIKRGTGSAVPSGLADGELAINLDSGQLYFGSGSTSVNSFRFTNLTADNYTVSSSVTNYVFQTLSGSSDFGDDVGDIHNRTGSLNISGALSMNGDIELSNNDKIFVGSGGTEITAVNDDYWTFKANGVEGLRILNNSVVVNEGGQAITDFRVESDSDTHLLFVDAGANKMAIGTDTVSDSLLTVDGDVKATNITASGDISASGNILSPTYGIAGVQVRHFGGLRADEGIYAISNITASGNISSSAYIYGVRYYANDQLALNNVNGAITLGYDNTYPINIGKDTNPIKLYGDITASGNISSSGTITANGGTFTDDITFSDTKGLNGARIVISGSTNNQVYGDTTFHHDVAISGDITTNLRIGGSGNTSNNWITIDAQNGNDSSGGGICFYETGTDTIGAPQYGAKIVYNEDDDEFAIGTMDNNTFKRQIYMKRNLDYVYLADAVFSEGTSPGFILKNTNTTVADGDSLGNLAWSNNDDTGTTLNIKGTATEDHADDANGGSKIEFQVTPNGTSALATAVTIDQDKSLTVVGDINANGNIVGDGATQLSGLTHITAIGNMALGNHSSDSHVITGKTYFVGSVTASVDISASGTITGNSIVGPLATAAQTNITSVGTLSSLTVSGDITANGNIVGDDSTNITNISSIECDSLVHDGDTDTKLTFGTDQIRFTAGNTIVTTFSSTLMANNLPATNKFEVSGTNAGDTGGGDIVYFGGTTSMVAGSIYHYKSDGTWELADADDASTSDGLLGVALGASSDTNGVLLRGMVTLGHDPGQVGDVLYVSTNPGSGSATAPSGNGDIVRIIGYCLHATNGQIWFNPDSTFVEVNA